MGTFSDEMTAVRLISDDHENDFDKMIGYFKSAMTVKDTVDSLETHCNSFLEVLDKVNDVCEGHAKMLNDLWTIDAESLKIPLKVIGGNRHRNPKQEVGDGDGSYYHSYIPRDISGILRSFQSRKYQSKHKQIKAEKVKQWKENRAIILPRVKETQPPVHHPKDQVGPLANKDDDKEYYSEVQESTVGGNSSSMQWVAPRLQREIGTLKKDLPDGGKACTVMTEAYSHTSFSLPYKSDGLEITGDPIITHKVEINLRNLAETQSNNKLMTLPNEQRRNSSCSPTSPTSAQELRNREVLPAYPEQPIENKSSSVSPPVTSNTQDMHLPTTSDGSTNKDALVSPTRGGSVEVNYLKTRRSSSLPDIHYFDAQPVQSDSFRSTQGDLKKSEIILPRTSTAAVTATSDNEQIVMGKLILEATKNAQRQAENIEELHKRDMQIAVLEIQLKEKETQLKDKNAHIKSLLAHIDKLMDLLKILFGVLLLGALLLLLLLLLY